MSGYNAECTTTLICSVTIKMNVLNVLYPYHIVYVCVPVKKGSVSENEPYVCLLVDDFVLSVKLTDNFLDGEVVR